MNTNQLTPVAIIVAGIIIAGAVMFSNSGSSASPANVGTQAGPQDANRAEQLAEQNVDISRDHMVGDVDAKVTIIEYSDYECPFCARFHPTLERIVEEYDGEVAWVYRHFPLTSIHSNATGAANASECVAELAGNDAFWSYSKDLFANQRSLGTKFYVDTAEGLGISRDTFTECMNSGRHGERIQEDLDKVIASGGRGTPFSVVIDSKGEATSFSGALPYEQVKSVVSNAINK